MIVGDDLRAWLSDGAAQRRTRKEIDTFAAQWRGGTVRRSLAAQMALPPHASAEQVRDAACRLFAEPSWVDRLIGNLAAALRHDPFFEPPFQDIHGDIHRGLVLLEDDLVSIAMGVTNIASLAARKIGKSARASVAFSGHVEVFKFVKAGGARLSFWTAPLIGEDFMAAEAGRCRRAGERRIEDGEILVLDGRCESFVVEHATSNLLLLQATAKPDRAPVSVEYDSESHEYVGCSAADDSASRIQMLTTLLRKLGHDAAVPAMAEFLDHPNFFVRWHVMRELLGLDVVAAMPHLKRMAARDRHPETRRAARAVLDQIEAPRVAPRKVA
ncbi:HEAT repeat domain-containing protein [Sphingosinicella sp. CPCC 101087]|uniref:HEAT repeat domain-containing protein n=1 Tax=Sphingosinicella sp. CPCC 101087 TaxID=2497754 RepID=UPI00101CBBBA|nr:HEAT repeat domain-containing protein [Sphingosinicella sp. CPCC 101087]